MRDWLRSVTVVLVQLLPVALLIEKDILFPRPLFRIASLYWRFVSNLPSVGLGPLIGVVNFLMLCTQ
jgi:hypothetical protein